MEYYRLSQQQQVLAVVHKASGYKLEPRHKYKRGTKTPHCSDYLHLIVRYRTPYSEGTSYRRAMSRESPHVRGRHARTVGRTSAARQLTDTSPINHLSPAVSASWSILRQLSEATQCPEIVSSHLTTVYALTPLQLQTSMKEESSGVIRNVWLHDHRDGLVGGIILLSLGHRFHVTDVNDVHRYRSLAEWIHHQSVVL